MTTESTPNQNNDAAATVKLPTPEGKKVVMVTPDQAKIVRKTLDDAALSKSAKIRALVGTGLTQYKTAQLLGVIPQFVNNVITRDANKATKAPKA